ncbi:UDP-N-acetylmuramoylalanine--D-glutamate ligase [Halolactibacillus alkaliphilus]|uniref:UDP-N-acetylmuramoylalanine--D-glutamate ligase n=1 Tax=Halolactibacillus alkaliphilus TaxID=442899 RepID=A0A511WX41_9BACI|nr:UDP-N-acetylmuramoyl-L-alanine--D-glutamate ligase [Halolactibacillus alkaliphilus]GEN55695.1 UDP-N-acetylmuramoylalanine--D-glutamate ligase [Halolactibacillus alkaliphilus]GGN65360.1 UDP-N-acetylmuramoylalanine--D-glutamate ligase [Halolactibacillus alkaliphilus]SFO63864.1 UDP-N-acetylmuramoylalanine--D-glutamate ligase [Halolactibacillus alkaliphilus]
MVNHIEGFPYQRILVLGLAKTGTAVSQVLKKEGFKVLVSDLSAKETDENVKVLKDLGVTVHLGEPSLQLLEDVDVIIKNPGIPYTNTLLVEAEKKHLPILTEIELLAYMIDVPIIAITGSNGKTTTTTLTEKMLAKSNKNVVAAGNIGKVATDIAYELTQDQTLVLELSSFQLMGVNNFRPTVSVLLNLFEAHLDYHGDFSAYQEAKARIFRAQQSTDYLVYNADNEAVSHAVKSAQATKIPFSSKRLLKNGGYIKNQALYFKDTKIIDIKDIKLVGDHNLENILASSISALLTGATIEGIRAVLTTFTGVKHRLQFVDEKNGVKYYNDSKATNTLATITALEAFRSPIRLIAGGLDRGNGFDDLIPHLKNVSGIYLYGETKDKLKETATKVPVPHIVTGESLAEVTLEAAKDAQPGEIVLLSPACASWDQFSNFEIRGDIFIEAVHTL